MKNLVWGLTAGTLTDLVICLIFMGLRPVNYGLVHTLSAGLLGLILGTLFSVESWVTQSRIPPNASWRERYSKDRGWSILIIGFASALIVGLIGNSSVFGIDGEAPNIEIYLTTGFLFFIVMRAGDMLEAFPDMDWHIWHNSCLLTVTAISLVVFGVFFIGFGFMFVMQDPVFGSSVMLTRIVASLVMLRYIAPRYAMETVWETHTRFRVFTFTVLPILAVFL